MLQLKTAAVYSLGLPWWLLGQTVVCELICTAVYQREAFNISLLYMRCRQRFRNMLYVQVESILPVIIQIMKTLA